ncbi:MAG: LamG domain-containing protein, partial [Gammaproteobacteria bacterium]|nr:LamG domain-containing protein [Gammaproteobacteria bacterium]
GRQINNFGEYWDGAVSDVQIFNIALSAEQIANLSNGNENIIVAEETTLNEIWQSCVTPNDGIEDGLTKCSDSLTIIDENTPPTHDTPILTIDITSRDLTSTPQNTFDVNGDDVKNIFNCYKDEGSGLEPIQVLNMPFEANDGNETSFTKDYSDSGYNGTVIGATWNA